MSAHELLGRSGVPKSALSGLLAINRWHTANPCSDFETAQYNPAFDRLIYEEIHIGWTSLTSFGKLCRCSVSDPMVAKVNDLVMLKPKEVAVIKAEIDRLEKALKNCADSGLRRWIEVAIEKQKKKLASSD